MYQKLKEFLGAVGVQYELITHAGAVTAQEQAEVSHASGWSVAKVVIVKERDGFVMAVLPACCVLDLNRLKGMIGHGDLRLASVEGIGRAIPDCVPGAIPPFGRLFGLRSFIDRSLLNAGEITMPAGDVATSIRMRAAEFLRLAHGQVGDFAVPSSMMPPIRETRRRKPGRRRAA
jgi:Ala-tRNA(Pro) deacylase